VTVCPNGLMIN